MNKIIETMNIMQGEFPRVDVGNTKRTSMGVACDTAGVAVGGVPD